MKNQEKFDALRKYNLPLGQYAITASGPLGIRNLREIDDIDLIVSQDLWEILSQRFGITETEKVKKIDFPENGIEAFCEGSFLEPADPNIPTVAERIAAAEIIEGLPFESLENTLLFKRLMGRKKDLCDINLIKNWLQQKSDS